MMQFVLGWVIFDRTLTGLPSFYKVQLKGGDILSAVIVFPGD